MTGERRAGDVSPCDQVRRYRVILFLAGATGLAAGWPAAAADDAAQQKLQQIERELEQGRGNSRLLERQADGLRQEIRGLRRRLVAAAAAAQREEETILGLARKLAAYRAEEQARDGDLARRQEALAATLGVLQRLAYRPPEALIVSRTPVIDTLRSSILLSAVVPALEAEASRLGAELKALRGLREDILEEKSRMLRANLRLDKERRELDRLFKRKGRTERRARAASLEERQRLARLAAEADDLRALIASLDLEQTRRRRDPRDPVSGSASRPFSSARGRMPLPARGVLVRRFGQATEFGTAAKGISIETRPGAQVITPFDGHLVFAGTFRRYGQLLIIAHSEGYHTLIAGISHIDGVVGQWLLSGEPIGRMADGGAPNPILYVELRRSGEPIDPLQWLTASERKVRG